MIDYVLMEFALAFVVQQVPLVVITNYLHSKFKNAMVCELSKWLW